MAFQVTQGGHNKVHVVAIELPQLLSQNTNIIFWQATAQNRCQTVCSSEVIWKKN